MPLSKAGRVSRRERLQRLQDVIGEVTREREKKRKDGKLDVQQGNEARHHHRSLEREFAKIKGCTLKVYQRRRLQNRNVVEDKRFPSGSTFTDIEIDVETLVERKKKEKKMKENMRISKLKR